MVRIKLKPKSKIHFLYRCPNHPDEQYTETLSAVVSWHGQPPACTKCRAIMRAVEMEVIDGD